jgi:hypothetical protein
VDDGGTHQMYGFDIQNDGTHGPMKQGDQKWSDMGDQLIFNQQPTPLVHDYEHNR